MRRAVVSLLVMLLIFLTDAVGAQDSYVTVVLLKYDYVVEECGLTYVIIDHPPALVQVEAAYPPFNVTSTTIDIASYWSREKMRKAKSFKPEVMAFLKGLEQKYDIKIVNALPWPEGIIHVYIYNLRAHASQIKAEVESALGGRARELGIYIGLIEALYPDNKTIYELKVRLARTFQHYRFETKNLTALPKILRENPASVGSDFNALTVLIFNKSVVPTKDDVLEVASWVRSIIGRCDIPIILQICEPAKAYLPDIPPAPPAPAGFGRSLWAGIGLMMLIAIPLIISILLVRRRAKQT